MPEKKLSYYLKPILLLLIFAVTALLTRQFFYQLKHMNEADASSGIEKIKAFERVILNHFPLSPYTKNAVDKILIECEGFIKTDEKLYCYETLRSSLIQIKSFYQPYEDTIKKINPKIAELRAESMISWEYNNLTKKDFERIYTAQLALLNYNNAPSQLWSAVTVFSLIGWISTIIFLIMKGFTKNQNRRYIVTGILIYLVFFLLWLCGLYFA
ncbi:MAG: hypothetical protein QMD43_03005 [Thermodesulfovibrio sp.]|uniref:hypothetical protein n=1 Tax=Thermodesulfovibrio sp. N1 TaxID=1871110 RepID=UPI00083AAC79|nr:hypothetical protein [Thermodesulfovibrio sp. N1]MDI6713982.1 hypothetical protein [Thermodesulfovibrio sp.]ODA44992.1 hypothetical protein THER_0219 [Thermodesulfovibrio sp. N1]